MLILASTLRWKRADRWLFALTSLIVILSGSSGLWAQQEAPKTQLDRLAYLVGGRWTAEGEIPGFGNYTAERTYEWMLDGKFIEQRHVMTLPNAEIETKGVIGWNPEQQAIVAWGFGSDGGIATTVGAVIGPDELAFEGKRVGAFNAGDVRATFHKIHDDEFTEKAEIKRDGQWQEMFTFRFRRTD